MADKRRKVPTKATGNSDVDAFLEKVAAMPVVKAPDAKGRLIFAMDATMSRRPTWDRACHIQAQMFKETAAIGGLEIQLAWFRGMGEFKAHSWAGDAETLLGEMTGVSCRGGYTQLEKVLRHAVAETKRQKVNALVYVGDCFEEDVDRVCAVAGELGLLGVPCFMFHEGGEPVAGQTFREIARLTNGAYCSFDSSSAKVLRDLLSAVAVYAAGGRKALADFGAEKGGAVLQIARQVK